RVVVVVARVVVVVAAVVAGAFGSIVAVVGVDSALWLAAESSATALNVWTPAARLVVVTDQCPVELATVPPRRVAPSRRWIGSPAGPSPLMRRLVALVMLSPTT